MAAPLPTERRSRPAAHPAASRTSVATTIDAALTRSDSATICDERRVAAGDEAQCLGEARGRTCSSVGGGQALGRWRTTGAPGGRRAHRFESSRRFPAAKYARACIIGVRRPGLRGGGLRRAARVPRKRGSACVDCSPKCPGRWPSGSLRSLGREFVPLLAAIAAHGSLAAAARALALSYRGAWGLIEAAERATGATLRRARTGARRAACRRPASAWSPPTPRARAAGDATVAALRVPVREPARHAAPTAPRCASPPATTWRWRRCARRGACGTASTSTSTAAPRASRCTRPARSTSPAFTSASRRPPAARDAAPHPRRAAALPPALAGADPAARQSAAGEHARRRRRRKRLRFVNRQPGSGTRLLLDQLLAQGGLRPADVDGYANEEFTHAAVAATVAAGKADAGVGLEAAAREFGLAFVPLAGEDYLFVCRRRALRSPAITAFRALLADDANARRGSRASPATPSTTPAPMRELRARAPTARSRCCRRDGVSATGRPEREHRSAQREGVQLSATGRPGTGARSAKELQ